MEQKTIYSAHNRRVAFTGTAQECWEWLMNQAFHMPDGRIIYREWTENGDRFIDVGNVYIYNN